MFLFLVILSNFLIIPVVKEKIQVKLALAIPTGVLMTVNRYFNKDKEIIDTSILVADKAINILSM